MNESLDLSGLDLPFLAFSSVSDFLCLLLEPESSSLLVSEFLDESETP